jgi:hypothetical protein
MWQLPTTMTRPSFKRVAAWSQRTSIIGSVSVHLSATGSYTSAAADAPVPPTTKSLPFERAVIVWPALPAFMLATGAHELPLGSYAATAAELYS